MEQRIFHLYSLIRVFTLLPDYAVIERLLSFMFSSDYCSFVLVWRIPAAAWEAFLVIVLEAMAT